MLISPKPKGMSSENLSATPSLSSIESAIKLIDVKKDELKRAFDDLQANSQRLSSFSISWSDLDSHFTALQNSVTQRFRILLSREAIHNPTDHVPTQPLASKQGDPSAPHPLTEQDPVDSVVNQPLTHLLPLDSDKPSSSNSLSVQSDGSVPPSGNIDSVNGWQGVEKYINDHVKEREAIRMELPDALQSAADPGAMVLDAMEGFYAENSQSRGEKDPEFLGLRRVCVVLLEQLMETGLSFSEEVRERAKKLALEWKGKVRLRKDNSLETSAFLHLVATYSLGAMFDKEELVGYFFTIAKFRQATMLCRSIGLGEKVHGKIISFLIECNAYLVHLILGFDSKLLDSGKQLLAVRLYLSLGLAEKFSPVPLLEEYLNETKKLAQQVCQNGKNTLKSQNEAASKEIVNIRGRPLQKRIEQLEKQLANRKPPATPAAPKPQQPQASQPVAQRAKKKKKQAPGKQQQSGNKRPKTTASVVHAAPLLSAAGSTSAVAPFQPPGLLLDHSAAYLSSSPIPFGFPGPTAVNPYAGPSAAMYGLAGAPMGFPVNPNSSASHLYNYDRLPTYGAYGFPPQFHPSYHPK
ncbi:hypothetical protein CXB51_034172 [Gossypium anomalum]|uniref:FRIGIDA-like protein n=1 Tax=Gossypium anomalum TaxID=47600 RepID=A0A8J5Y199_9ROSI|nr:hypothetical protein CXB51_034172 [Gossypium anomalum]